MKKCVGLLVCVVGLSVPSFAAEHLVSRSVKVVANDTYKVTKVSAKNTGKAGGIGCEVCLLTDANCQELGKFADRDGA